MAPARKRKRACMMTVPEAVEIKPTETATENPESEPRAQPSRPDSTQRAKEQATDDPPAQWPESEADAEEAVVQTTTAATTQRTKKTAKPPKLDEFGRTVITVKDKRFAKLLDLSKVRFQLATRMKPEELAGLGALTSPRPAVSLNLSDDQLAAIGTQLYSRLLQKNNEQELRLYLTHELLRYDAMPTQEGVQRLAHRRDSWKERKGPPVAENSNIVFDYTGLEVDTTYMVHTSMFPRKMWEVLTASEDHSYWLAESYGVAPYLSFEFKSALSGEPDSIARHQVAAAAAIWLFMRKELREKVASAPISYHDIRHYGVILTATHFAIYEATTDGQAYNLKQVGWGMTYDDQDLRSLVRWLNAIHLWGLNPNADSFKKDLEDLTR
ncbi:MAG: hypothetical protein M1816_000455 [Peltula sp. TS41687]|nr:MAG: hypothetical protein M1816_000455 [Peltula sp. TS41687]